jgi:hypothetical protein
MSIRHDRDLRFRKTRTRKKRPKTFKSAEAAKKYADANKIKDYVLEDLSFSSTRNKIRIVKK